MDRTTKILMIIAMIIVVIILLIMAILNINNYDHQNVIPEIDETGLEEEELKDFEDVLQEVKYRNNYYAVQACVEKFYTYYEECFMPDLETQEIAKSMYYIFDEKYINYKGLTESNIIGKLKSIEESEVNINEMYVNQKTDNIYIYIVKGRLREKISGNLSDFELMVTLDINNETFTILMEDYIKEYHKNIKLGENLEIEVPKSIEANDYNRYDYQIISDDEYLEDLIFKYKKEILQDRETAYNHLDAEYRQKRFPTLSEFETYAKQNTYKNVVLKLDSYKKKKYDNYTEYVCLDTKGNYYIFREKTVMNYGMILDTYTVDLPDFIEKYDAASENEKVALNINKIIMSVNEKDYKYAYNKLNATYKNTYFSNYNIFVKAIQNNFFEKNTMTIEELSEAGENTYTATVRLTNAEDTTQTKKVAIAVRLLEDRNFEISFGIE